MHQREKPKRWESKNPCVHLLMGWEGRRAQQSNESPKERRARRKGPAGSGVQVLVAGLLSTPACLHFPSCLPKLGHTLPALLPAEILPVH